MANIYVRSTDGSDADNGSTWALAKATLSGAAAIDAAGDVIYVSQVHAESTAAAITFDLAGTTASPTKVICVNDAAAPPTSVSTAASISTTGANGITVKGGHVYAEGLTFNVGSGASGASFGIAGTSGARHLYTLCTFKLNTTSSAARINASDGASNPWYLLWKNCNVLFSNSGQTIGNAGVRFEWDGGSVVSGSVTPTTNGLVQFGTRQGGDVLISGVDLTNFGSTLNICSFSTFHGKLVIRNCKLPAAWAGSLVTGTIPLGARAEMHNCDAADTNYRLWVEDYSGNIKSETTVVVTGGASDGTTPFAWKMASTANASYPVAALHSPEIVKWNDTTGSAITATVEIITDNVTLTDAECWIEVQYLGTSGFPLSVFVSDAKADILATAANQSSSSVTWTTTGLGTPVKQKLSVTFTPQEKGFLHAVVHLAKASTTVYVDPLLTIT